MREYVEFLLEGLETMMSKRSELINNLSDLANVDCEDYTESFIDEVNITNTTIDSLTRLIEEFKGELKEMDLETSDTVKYCELVG